MASVLMIVPSRRSASMSARADLPLAVGPATISAFFCFMKIGPAAWLKGSGCQNVPHGGTGSERRFNIADASLIRRHRAVRHLARFPAPSNLALDVRLRLAPSLRFW